MNKKVFVMLANGFEIIEAMAPVDILRRAGVEVVTVSVIEGTLEVESAQKVKVIADTTLSKINVEEGEMVVIPGGYPGYINLRENSKVVGIVKNYLEKNKYVGAICGGPTIFGVNNLIGDYKFTCHSAVKGDMGSNLYEDKDVVIDRNIITSQGAGTSIEFGLALAGVLVGAETVEKVKKGMELV